ncbi:MFS transporter [Bremerella cremea]|uniref:MFS transporter n=1 Tax=Bremerella cremea TaxID=1031537 RepID=A0A368KN78_9BACT|nr:MFS transporter [Bremerella cremea]RCS44698.1 MFS transporter [Bremerella cremea]
MATDAASLEAASVRRDPIVQATPFFYGWVMLGVAMFTQYCTSPGQTYGVALFNKYIATTLATATFQQAHPGQAVVLSKELIDAEMVTVTTAYLLGTILAAFPVPWIGALADRWGLRRTITVTVALFGMACMFMSQVQGFYTLFIGFLAIRTLGQGSLTLLATNTADMWFQRKLGFANGIRNLSAPIAFGTFPIITIFLINELGWKQAYVALGVGVWLIMFPILIFIYRNHPEEIGQLPDGDKRGVREDGQPHDPGKLFLLPQLSLGDALQTRSFWIVLSFMTMWGMIGTALMFMVVPFIELRGLTEEDAQVVFLSMAVSMALCQFFGGILADRFKLNYLLAIGSTMLGVGVLTYWSINSVWMAGVYGVMFGMAQGISGAGSNSLLARYYGRAHLGKIKGFQMMTIVAGSAAGPYLMSVGKEYWGNYDRVLWLFATMFFVQAVACFFATPPAERKDIASPHTHPNLPNANHGTDPFTGAPSGDQPQPVVQAAD